MHTHVVAFFLGSALLLLVCWGLRWLVYAVRKKQIDSSLQTAAQQLRQTGILLRLGSEPREIKSVQSQLRMWGYAGKIDGVAGPETIAAYESYATHSGIDLDRNALSFIQRRPAEEALPAAQQQLLTLQRARAVVQTGLPVI